LADAKSLPLFQHFARDHPPDGDDERKMKHFNSPGSAQRFLSIQSAVLQFLLSPTPSAQQGEFQKI
jgi:hypothetical protein